MFKIDNRALTVKQQKFCDFYIQVGNATEAARMAGYSNKTCAAIASENLQKPHLMEYINERLEEMKSTNIADSEEVLKYLTAIMRGEEVEEEIVLEGEERVAGVMIKALNTRDRIKAAELIGKRYALFTDRQQLDVDANVGVTIIDDI